MRRRIRGVACCAGSAATTTTAAAAAAATTATTLDSFFQSKRSYPIYTPLTLPFFHSRITFFQHSCLLIGPSLCFNPLLETKQRPCSLFSHSPFEKGCLVSCAFSFNCTHISKPPKALQHRRRLTAQTTLTHLPKPNRHTHSLTHSPKPHTHTATHTHS